MRQRKSGLFGSFDAPWSERTTSVTTSRGNKLNWIELRDLGLMCFISKETQNPLSDSFGFKDSILDFLKETHPKCEKCLVEKYCWNKTDDEILPVLHNFSELWFLFPRVATGYFLWCCLRQLFICLVFKKRKKAVKYLNLF